MAQKGMMMSPDAETAAEEEAEIQQIMKTKGVTHAQAKKILASMPMSKED